MTLTALLTISCYLASTVPSAAAASFSLVKEYSGNSFFDQWNYYGNYDNWTNGDAQYLDQTDAMSQKLTYVNPAGNAIIKVDNTTNVVWNNKRNTIRLESKDFYNVGTVWIMDAVHLPYGCSVWPSLWTKAASGWPDTGEIDIIEYVNAMTTNQYALHSGVGCTQGVDSNQIGKSTAANCNTTQGCTVTETKQASNAQAFAAAGGGVYATQFDASGIYIWFWSRPDVPKSISSATSSSSLDISDFGNPSASYPATACNTSQHFGAQQLVIDITLCGDWANAPNVFNASGLCTGLCYNDNVVGNGSVYNNAYFEIPYIRAYSNAAVISPSGSSSGSSGAPAPTGTGSGGSSDGANNSNGAWKAMSFFDTMVLGVVGAVAMVMLHV